MFHMSSTELIIVLVIVVLLFGVGRIGKIAGELGKGVRDFHERCFQGAGPGRSFRGAGVVDGCRQWPAWPDGLRTFIVLLSRAGAVPTPGGRAG